jgi:protein disulfide-isomerase
MSSQPVEITCDDFSGLLLKKKFDNKIVLIKFYTNWCGFCKRTIPLFNNLANYYKKDNSVVIAEYDCENEDNQEYINDYINKFNYGFKVQGYPTIIIYKNGVFNRQYEGERSERALIQTLDSLKK